MEHILISTNGQQKKTKIYYKFTDGNMYYNFSVSRCNILKKPFITVKTYIIKAIYLCNNEAEVYLYNWDDS